MLKFKSLAQQGAIMAKIKHPKTLTNPELEFALTQFQKHVSTSARLPTDELKDTNGIHQASIQTLNQLITEKRNRGLYK